ncbi:MAG TPA: hypothetical protein VGQ91_11735, partial [Ideonella sp.]|nr:hypothetical protein [Ideonella sp.]
MLHALLVALLLNLPGLGDAEQARATVLAQRQVDAQLAHTAERALQQRVERMEQILRLMSEGSGMAPPPLPGPTDGSPVALAARAQALSEAIEVAERRLRAAALARLARIPLAQATREVEARAAAERPAAPASTPAETIEQLERRAREALEVQRAQVEAQRNGVRVARAEAPTAAASGSAGQARPADGIPRSLAVQLAAEFRNGPPQGRVGEAGVEGGRSVNPKRVQGMAGGRIAHADDPLRVNPFGEGAPVKLPGSSLDLTGQGGPTGLDFVRPPKVDIRAVRTAAGRVFGPGGAFANRVYLDSWYVIGPFTGEGENPIDAVFPPEEGIDLDGSYRGLDGRIVGWHYASRGFYPFIPPQREERAVYYAYTELRIAE